MKNQYLIIKIGLTVLALILIRTTTFGCDCIPASEVFTENIKKSPLVIHARVIQQLEKKDGYFGDLDFTGITQLKVLHSFKGKLWTDTLIHINLTSLDCGSSIQDLAVNQEVFLKAYLTSNFEGLSSTNNNTDLMISSKIDSLILKLGGKYQNIESGYCDVTTLPVIDGEGYGRIFPSKHWKEYRRLEKNNLAEAKRYLEKYVNHGNSFQKLSVRKIYGIINKEIKGYR